MNVQDEALVAYGMGVPLSQIGAIVASAREREIAEARARCERNGWAFRVVRVTGSTARQLAIANLERSWDENPELRAEAEERMAEMEAARAAGVSVNEFRHSPDLQRGHAIRNRVAAALAKIDRTPRPGASMAVMGKAATPTPVPAASYGARVHEAAHAAVGLALGLHVEKVHASPDAAFTLFHHLGRGNVAAIAAIAGLAAERAFCDPSLRYSDYADSADMQRFTAATDGIFHEMRIEAAAERMVREHRPAILRIAAALEGKHELDEAEVLELFHG